MIRIVEEGRRNDTKRYNIATVAKATGKTEGSIQGYFSNKKIGTRAGITIGQIAEVCRSRTRGQTVKWEQVNEIRARLREEYGIRIIDDDSNEEQLSFKG